MNGRLGWALVALLSASLVGQLSWGFLAKSGFSTLPIFVPVSLEYERTLRATRGQAPTRSGDQILSMMQALDTANFSPTPELKAKLDALVQTRAQLMEEREKRHQLNTALMEVAISVVAVLKPAQWEQITMHRDELRAKAEAEVYARVEKKLGP